AAVVSLPNSSAHATDWGPRGDVGVAAVDTRTGNVLWEAWRLDEVPAGASKSEKTAVEYLLASAADSGKPLPRVPILPAVSVKDLVVEDPGPRRLDLPEPQASQGKSLIYYRHARVVIALDQQTGRQAWLLETMRFPYPSLVLEAGENQALIQIGSDIPVTIRA